MVGLAAVLAAIYGVTWYFGTQLGASVLRDTAVKAADIVNPVNTAWTLVTAFLVFFMQAGFMMLEGGFARTREVSNIMIECIIDTAMCGLLFWAFGFAFMFGNGNGWIGYHFFFLQGIPHTYGTTGVAFLAFFLFQFAFADTASTIVSGAMVGRTGFKGDLIYSIGVRPRSVGSSSGSAGTGSTRAARSRPWTSRASAGSRPTRRWRRVPVR
jgi:Amt family ammonium transporter